MDPLHLTATVIATFETSSKMIDRCYHYLEVDGNASQDANRILSEVASLQDILLELLRIAAEEKQEGSSYLPVLIDLARPDGPLHQCQTEMCFLLRALDEQSGGKAIERALKGPGKEKEIKSSLESIRASKASLTLAVSVHPRQAS